MISTEYLRKLGFREIKLYGNISRGIFRKPKKQFWGYSYFLGDIQIAICALDNDSPFEYKLNDQKIGILPDSKKFLKQLIKYYG